MLITIVNQAREVLWDHSKLFKVTRAINRQIAEDFAPYWNLSGRVRLAITRDTDSPPDPTSAGGPVVYLTTWKKWSVANFTQALEMGGYCKGFHERTGKEFPVAHIFVDPPPTPDNAHLQDAAVFREDWVVTLSHEILETIANPHLNLWSRGPHPDPEQPGEVYVAREVCDPVQDEYELDKIRVANFVLPLYFLNDGGKTERIDFLGRRDPGDPLCSFGVRKGGYVPFRRTQHEIRNGQQQYVEVDDKWGRSLGSGEPVPVGYHKAFANLLVSPTPLLPLAPPGSPAAVAVAPLPDALPAPLPNSPPKKPRKPKRRK